MSGKEINQVRQILMNELGLSREMIHGMASELVRIEVEKQVHRLLQNGHIQQMAIHAVDRFAQESAWDRETVRRIIEKAVVVAIQERVLKDMRSVFGRVDQG